MSGTVEAPRGLDTLTAEDQRLLDDMRDDAPASPAAPPPPPAPVSTETTTDFEVDIPDEPPPAADRRQTTVPQQALHAEREKRKAAEKLAADHAAALAAANVKSEKDAAVLQARLEMIAKAVETAPAAPAPAPVAAPAEEQLPDKTIDPIGYFEALVGRQAKQIEALTGLTQGFTETQQRQQRATELRNWGIAQELAFEAREPNYRAAMDWLMKSRHAELTALKITDPVVRQQMIAQDVNNIATRAHQTGDDFAETMFRTAAARGWAPPAPVAAATPAIPALDAALADTATDRALRVEQGRANSTSIGSLGAAPAVRLSAQKIADMSESEFAAVYDKIKGDPVALRQLMGN